MSNIFEVLKEDHDLHREMLKTIATSKGKERADAFEAFRVEVSAHAAAEEESLYATMLAAPDLRDDARHSVSEHKEIDDLLGELQGANPDNGNWQSHFDKLRHRYEHHIDEEEEEMFPEAEKNFTPEISEKLGAKFDRRKPKELENAENSKSGGDERE